MLRRRQSPRQTSRIPPSKGITNLCRRPIWSIQTFYSYLNQFTSPNIRSFNSGTINSAFSFDTIDFEVEETGSTVALTLPKSSRTNTEDNVEIEEDGDSRDDLFPLRRLPLVGLNCPSLSTSSFRFNFEEYFSTNPRFQKESWSSRFPNS